MQIFMRRVFCLAAAIFLSARFPSSVLAQTGATNAPPNADNVLLTAEGKVESMKASTDAWTPAQLNQTFKVQDKVRTGMKSRATVRLSNQSVLRLNQLTTIEIQPAAEEGRRSVLDLKSGAAYFYNREGPGETQFRTPLA